ncbi:hypothetical protein R1sor_005137 [Riccia sorocarpa]|uniref:Uncharacterized protein n=1 Tax=Riccia sorocarpa TaxID=122646 RepID=A0ABD3HKP8_9MARC
MTESIISRIIEVPDTEKRRRPEHRLCTNESDIALAGEENNTSLDPAEVICLFTQLQRNNDNDRTVAISSAQQQTQGATGWNATKQTKNVGPVNWLGQPWNARAITPPGRQASAPGSPKGSKLEGKLNPGSAAMAAKTGAPPNAAT